MSQGSSSSDDTAVRGPMEADQLALALASGRVEYLAKLVITALTKDPYLRSPISDDWTWTQMCPLIQQLVDRKLEAGGLAAQRWVEVSGTVSAVTRMISGPTVNVAELARRLTDVGTDLMNVLHLINTELGTAPA